MSLPKDQGGLLGALIPNVFIDTITLEAGGTPPEVSNPHIEHERETKTSFSRDEGTMRMVVDTSVKEIISGEAISAWFGDKFARYVRLKIVTSTNPAVTSAFSKSNDGINILNGAYNADTTSDSMKILHAAFPGQDIFRAIENYTQTKEFDIYSDAIADELSLTQHSSSLDEDGNIIHDVNFRATFEFKGVEPAHLAVFAMCYLDMELLVSDYGLSYDEQTLKGQNGKIASEVAVDMGKIVSRSYVFTKADGKVWSGAVHSSADGIWMTEDSKTPESVELKLNIVANDKVQDFRDVDKIQRIPIDLTLIENSVLSSATRTSGNLKNIITDSMPRNVYFSDLFLARDREGNARMSFAVDYLRMLRENSSYEKLFSMANNTQRLQLSASCKIRSMRLVRRRVKETTTNNKLGNPVSGEVLFDKTQPVYTVASSGETSYGVFNEVNNPTATMRESYYTLGTQDFDVRFFTASDLDVSLKTDGLYQYGVEMVVEDASQKYIYSLIRDLRNHRNKLYEYYLNASKIGMNKFVVELQDPHIDSLWERARVKRSSGANFSIASGRFTNKFVLEQEALYETNKDSAPWVQPIVKYFEMLNLFTGFSSTAAAEDLVTSVQKYVAPKSGSPKGIMTFINMVDNLISRVSRIVGSDVPLGEGESTLYRKQVTELKDPISGEVIETYVIGRSESAPLPTKTTTVSHWFNNSEFDSNYVRNIGWDYLSSTSASYSGLRFITGEKYAERVTSETLKYFSDEDVSIDIDGVTTEDSTLKTGFGYLAPAEVSLGTTRVPFITKSTSKSVGGVISPDQYSSIEAFAATVTNFSAPTMSPQYNASSPLSVEAQMYQSAMLGQFANLNMTILPPLTNIPQPLTSKSSFLQPSISIRFCSELDDLPNDSNIDPVVSRVDEGGVNQQGLDKINANSLLSSLQVELRKSNRYFDGSTNQPFGGTSTKVVSSSPSKTLTSTNLEVGTISCFDVRSNTNVVNWMYKTPEYLKEVSRQHNSRNEDVPTVVASLPNHIKSLLLASVNPAAVTTNWHSSNVDPIADPRSSSEFAILYALINRVEVLTGFSGDVKNDRWEILTYDSWYASSGREMICRMKPYECKLFGIYRPKSLEMPIYDEYFALTPRTSSPVASGTGITDTVFDNSVSLSDWVVRGGYRGDTGHSSGSSTTNVTGSTSLSYPCDELLGKDAVAAKQGNGYV